MNTSLTCLSCSASFLVNCIIVPFRAPKSAKLYRQLWDKKGSPLLYYSESLKDKLQAKLGTKHEVFIGMRYGNPSIKKAITAIKLQGFKKLICIPLYPQYATSTTYTSMGEVNKQVKKQALDINLEFIDAFFDKPKFIEAITAQAKKHDLSAYDHIIFSYHGLPVNQTEDTHKGHSCKELNCHTEYNASNKHCYHASCYATTRLLSRALKLDETQYTSAFQSRLSKNWLEPFTDDIILEKAKTGKKNILVICPAFVADCLETTIEIAYEYDELFKQNGGKTLQLVESLNDSNAWVHCLASLIN